jgi:hypothetical protein
MSGQDRFGRHPYPHLQIALEQASAMEVAVPEKFEHRYRYLIEQTPICPLL